LDQRLDGRATEAALAHLKVEVNINENRSFYPLVPIEVQVPDGAGGVRPVSVISYDLDEMLGTKLRALLQREHGRDLFDLWWAWAATKETAAPARVNPERGRCSLPLLHGPRGQHIQGCRCPARARTADDIEKILG